MLLALLSISLGPVVCFHGIISSIAKMLACEKDKQTRSMLSRDYDWFSEVEE